VSLEQKRTGFAVIQPRNRGSIGYINCAESSNVSVWRENMGWVGFEFSVIHINRSRPVFCSAAGGQFHFESRSGSLFALDGDGAVMIVENSFYDKQSEAGALDIGRACKTLELPK
jgi:hypothetical protein